LGLLIPAVSSIVPI
jgi:hypothetical protein